MCCAEYCVYAERVGGGGVSFEWKQTNLVGCYLMAPESVQIWVLEKP